MKEIAASGRKGYVCLTDVGNVIGATKDEELQTAINASLLSLPDGAPLACYARLAGYKGAERISGARLMELLFAEKDGFSHYLLGDTDQTIRMVIDKARDLSGGIEITGYSPPFKEFTTSDNREIAGRIREANPDIIWVSFGGGKQEKWMMNNIDRLDRGLMIGAGAAFKWFTGEIKEPAEIFQKLCLQWCFRLLSELVKNPQKGRKLFVERQLRKFPKFIINFPIELVLARRQFKRQS
jgi:N-acetylglucosaminyldiphosphoundecaprenol N-acetyl-beta-D-mannosaminyltransferase